MDRFPAAEQAPVNTWRRRFLSRWLWLCPALLTALLLVCPAIIVWGVVKLWRGP